MSQSRMTTDCCPKSKNQIKLTFPSSRDKIFDILKFAYVSFVHENLPIYGIAKQKTLAEFATTESDVARGISRMPLILARVYEEDLKFTDGKQIHKFKVSPTSF
jgi:hypothetical protein